MSEQRQADPDHADQPVPEARAGPLDLSDVRALRRADRVSFHHHQGQGYIHADLTTWPPPEPRTYTPRQQRLFPDPDGVDQRRRIEVDTFIVGFDHTRRWHWHERTLPGASAVHIVHSARLDEAWRSIAAFPRAGDVITLHWQADNNTGHVAAAGPHRDEPRPGVVRGRRRWQFLVDVDVATQNGRMVIHSAPR
jgi:hypothetical protein